MLTHIVEDCANYLHINKSIHYNVLIHYTNQE